MTVGIRMGAVALTAIAVLSAPARAQPAADGGIEVRVNPEKVCLDTRPTAHLNFDLVIRNGTTKPVTVREIRAVVLGAGDEMLERRLIWQDSVSVLAPHRTVAAGAEGVLFNPLAFNTMKPGRRLRYEVFFEEQGAPVTVLIQPVSCVTKARLILPMTGRLLVHDGHDMLSHHRRQAFYIEPELKAFGLVDAWYRFGVDLLPVDAKGGMFRGEGGRMEDWYGWEAPVRAPADGVVAAIHNDQPDNDQVGSENRWKPKKLSENEMDTDGNYVLIDHGGGEFSNLTHLRQGSVSVKKGDRVRAGQVVAKAGASGSSPVPHLHYELRSGWGVRGVRSLPPYFHGLKVVGTGEGPGPVAVNTGDVVIAR